ncbi:translocation protein sec62 [Cyclospora cayetanensis]|uniref:Translocation protein sec62 n=1 Tax=Cyclospora cayetanensis TaxID=88456 RepID=A0A1D3D4G5_9EIME|nr:translocation protein sec62 [Cyclospora cayetanensis]
MPSSAQHSSWGRGLYLRKSAQGVRQRELRVSASHRTYCASAVFGLLCIEAPSSRKQEKSLQVSADFQSGQELTATKMARTATPNWNKPLAAVMDLILNSTIKFKHAAEVGRRAVMYCRGPDLLEWVEANRELLNKKHLDALEKPIEGTADAVALCERLIRFGFLYRAQYRPRSPLDILVKEVSECSSRD